MTRRSSSSFVAGPSSSSCAARPSDSATGASSRGGLEPDETPREAAERELLEETGLRAEVVKLPLALSYSLLDDPPAIRARYGPGIETVTVHAFVADAPGGLGADARR